MIDDFFELLKKVAAGDESAIKILLTHFEAQTILPAEQEQAHIYLKQAGRQNHDAIYVRGLLYKKGYGVLQSYDTSYLLMREAAGKGNAKAMYEIGHHFLHGLGVEVDYVSALEWLQIAAGSPYYVTEAMQELGAMYEQGLGVAKDAEQANEWYEKAKHHR